MQYKKRHCRAYFNYCQFHNNRKTYFLVFPSLTFEPTIRRGNNIQYIYTTYCQRTRVDAQLSRCRNGNCTTRPTGLWQEWTPPSVREPWLWLESDRGPISVLTSGSSLCEQRPVIKDGVRSVSAIRSVTLTRILRSVAGPATLTRSFISAVIYSDDPYPEPRSEPRWNLQTCM